MSNRHQQTAVLFRSTFKLWKAINVQCNILTCAFTFTQITWLLCSCLSSFTVPYECVCVCRVGLRIRMSTSDELISVKRKKTGKKKTPTRPLPLRFSVRSSYWRLVYHVSVVARHRRPKDIRLSKEKKGGKTETDMQSKAMEGVPVVHTHTKTPFLIFLSIFLHLCWSSLPIFFLSFSSCWFNLHGLLHHYHRPSARWKKES